MEISCNHCKARGHVFAMLPLGVFAPFRSREPHSYITQELLLDYLLHSGSSLIGSLPPEGIEETARLPGLDGFLNLPVDDAHTYLARRRSCPNPPGAEGIAGNTRISSGWRGLGWIRNAALGRKDAA